MGRLLGRVEWATDWLAYHTSFFNLYVWQEWTDVEEYDDMWMEEGEGYEEWDDDDEGLDPFMDEEEEEEEEEEELFGFEMEL